jgi:2-isopropylmalate synthase
MSEYFERYAVQPKPIGELPHHQMEKAQGAFAANVFMDNSLVSEADLVINIGEMDLNGPLQAYVDPHSHDVSSCYAVVGNLTIEVTLAGSTREVKGPAGIFIPAGLMHSIRPLRGKGTLVVVQRSGTFE